MEGVRCSWVCLIWAKSSEPSSPRAGPVFDFVSPLASQAGAMQKNTLLAPVQRSGVSFFSEPALLRAHASRIEDGATATPPLTTTAARAGDDASLLAPPAPQRWPGAGLPRARGGARARRRWPK
jgi:hypothetical protein